MREVLLRPPTDGDLIWIADHMRPSDLEEVEATGARSPLFCLREGVEASPWCAVAEVEGEPVAIFGVAEAATLLGAQAAPWMLGTTMLNTLRRELWTISKRVVYAMSQDYPRLCNWVWEGSTASIRYLEALGFTVEPAVGKMRKFTMERHQDV